MYKNNILIIILIGFHPHLYNKMYQMTISSSLSLPLSLLQSKLKNDSH